jgi:hypothetical protein
LPGWLKLVETEGQCTGYTLTDGASWLAIGRKTASLTPNGATFAAGLATTAHDSSAPPTEFAIFDSVSLSAATPTNLCEIGFQGYNLTGARDVGLDDQSPDPAVSETWSRTPGSERRMPFNDVPGLRDLPGCGVTQIWQLHCDLYANADRTGALVGAHVNVGHGNVETRGTDHIEPMFDAICRRGATERQVSNGQRRSDP